jgi:tetratricopeptide (TPR) repeat protein
MTKDNIMFAIIGVLLGVIVGYVFATNIQQQEDARRALGSRTTGETAQSSELPENHPPISEMSGSSAETALIEKAQNEPGNFDAQMQAAALHYRSRRFNEALELLARANNLRPDSYEALVALGNTNFDAGRYEIAEKWYTAALAKRPQDVSVRTDLGLTFLVRDPGQDVDRAIKEFRSSLEIEPRHEQTLQNLVVALTKKGSLGEADRALKKLSEVNPSNQSLTRLRTDLEAARSSAKQPAAGRK